MAELVIQQNEIRANIQKLSAFFQKHSIEWSLITKVFSGDKDFFKSILTPQVIKDIHSVGDSRLTSLKNLKELNPNMTTIYIKPPAKVYAREIIEYADISFNSSFATIEALNQAAHNAGKIHRIIVMIELGELREGIKRSDILNFYEKVFRMSNIKVIGIGSNLGCMYGVEPTYDKLVQLFLYRELIAQKFQKELPLISGGTSITLPLIEKDMVPKDINHFRIGEAAFFGTSPLDNKPFAELSSSTFLFSANIIELEKKKLVPDGVIGDANIGHTAAFDDEDVSESSYKAILDFGLLDVDKDDLGFFDTQVQFVGVTSDMTVVDLGENKNKDGHPKYQVGDKIHFKPNYMAVARLLNSKFIDKEFI